MKYQHATIVVTNAVAVNLRKLSQMLDRSETDGMFIRGLSATGNPPATHWISSGAVPKVFITKLSSATALEAAARAAYLKEETTFPFTPAQIANALSKCTISDGTFNDAPEGVPELLERLGLKFIQE